MHERNRLPTIATAYQEHRQDLIKRNLALLDFLDGVNNLDMVLTQLPGLLKKLKVEDREVINEEDVRSILTAANKTRQHSNIQLEMSDTDFVNQVELFIVQQINLQNLSLWLRLRGEGEDLAEVDQELQLLKHLEDLFPDNEWEDYFNSLGKAREEAKDELKAINKQMLPSQYKMKLFTILGTHIRGAKNDENYHSGKREYSDEENDDTMEKLSPSSKEDFSPSSKRRKGGP